MNLVPPEAPTNARQILPLYWDTQNYILIKKIANLIFFSTKNVSGPCSCVTIYKKDFKTTIRRISIYVINIKTDLTQLNEIYLLKINGTS